MYGIPKLKKKYIKVGAGIQETLLVNTKLTFREKSLNLITVYKFIYNFQNLF